MVSVRTCPRCAQDEIERHAEAAAVQQVGLRQPEPIDESSRWSITVLRDGTASLSRIDDEVESIFATSTRTARSTGVGCH
jgi:hypothetical protein